ncbi:MAG: ATP synthase F0 subunit B [Deltaproteobacteria bacterium]|nr:ATP synthase F0 subunit B [Deltaproteobacteria bacterium]
MRRLLISLSLLGSSSVALAEETAHHGDTLTIWQILTSPVFMASVLNFLVLVTLLYVMGRKPIASFLTERRRQVEEGLKQAAALKAEAEKKLAEYTERLESLDEEMAAIRADLIKAGEAERSRIVAEAEKKAARMRTETRFLIEQRMKQVERELRQEAVDASIAAAQSVLEDKTTETDRQRLAQGYLQSLSKTESDPGVRS